MAPDPIADCTWNAFQDYQLVTNNNGDDLSLLEKAEIKPLPPIRYHDS